MKNLDICLVSLTIAPDSHDGSAKFFTGIFNYLKNQGHNVQLITGKWNEELKDPNIKQINLIKKSYSWIPQFSLNVHKYIKSKKYDIIHGNGPKGSLPLLLSPKMRFISTLHDLGPYQTKYSRIPIEKYLFREVAKKATYLTTCSNFIRKEIKRFIPKIDLNKIINLYSAIDNKYKPFPKEAQKLKENLGIHGPVLLYIGRIASYKGIENIITAYKSAKKEIPNLNLVIGGKPDFYMRKYYNIWQHKFKDINFVGFIDDQELPYYYSMGDIFINYSYASEGFGLTPIEAIACGTPVICSSLLVFQEILQDNAVFVPPKNPQKLTREIVNLLKNEDFRKNLIQKSQKFITKYTWKAVGTKLEKVYGRFLK